MQKIILYYKFTPIKDPNVVKLWQIALCEKLDLMGRIIVSPKGINGTLAGELDNLRNYVKEIKAYQGFKDIDFKWNDGSKEDFPRLNVKVRSETVTLGMPDAVKVTKSGVVNGGARLKPNQLANFVKDNPDAVLFDGRNNYESAIGKFKNAVIPDIDNFRDFPKELKKPKYKKLKAKPVVTYCTGGIRCEVLTALLKQEGFTKVYQLDGGIVKYGQIYGDKGLWEGKCFVFDDRISVGFSDSSVDIGSCVRCRSKTSRYLNCTNKTCNKLILICGKCSNHESCSSACNLAALSAI